MNIAAIIEQTAMTRMVTSFMQHPRLDDSPTKHRAARHRLGFRAAAASPTWVGGRRPATSASSRETDKATR
jgi:hypothetical protein